MSVTTHVGRNADRATFRVVRFEQGWAVEHDGGHYDFAKCRDEVMASASKRARAVISQGGAAQVVIAGERPSAASPTGSSLEWG